MIEKSLLIVFILIFVGTATITLLGIIQKVRIKEKYLNKLFTSLLLEVVASVIMLFNSIYLNNEYKIYSVNGKIQVNSSISIIEYSKNGKFGIVLEPDQIDIDEAGNFDFYLLSRRKNNKFILPKFTFKYSNLVPAFEHSLVPQEVDLNNIEDTRFKFEDESFVHKKIEIFDIKLTEPNNKYLK